MDTLFPNGSSELGLLPEGLQFVDGSAAYFFALIGQTAFDVAEALAEFGISAAQGLLGIDLYETREVDEHEQQVAQFVLQLVLRVALAGFVEFKTQSVEFG